MCGLNWKPEQIRNHAYTHTLAVYRPKSSTHAELLVLRPRQEQASSYLIRTNSDATQDDGARDAKKAGPIVTQRSPILLDDEAAAHWWFR